MRVRVWRLIVWLAKATGMPHWMFEVALPEQIGMRRYTRIDGRGQPVTLLVPFERRQETGS